MCRDAEEWAMEMERNGFVCFDEAKMIIDRALDADLKPVESMQILLKRLAGENIPEPEFKDGKIPKGGTGHLMSQQRRDKARRKRRNK